MQFSTTVLLVALVFALMAVTAVVAVFRDRARRRRLEEWAHVNDWQVVRRPLVGWTDQLPGRNRRGVSLLVRGTLHGRSVAVAEYSYTTRSGGENSTTTTHRFVVVLVRLPTSYPELSVVHRGAISRLGRALFGEGATEIGVPDFDRDFRVQAGRPELARSLVGPALVKEHLAGYLPGWTVAGHDLLTCQPGERLTDPERIPDLVGPLVRVADLLGR